MQCEMLETGRSVAEGGDGGGTVAGVGMFLCTLKSSRSQFALMVCMAAPSGRS